MEIFLLYLSEIKPSKCQGIMTENWNTIMARLGYRFSAFYGRVPVSQKYNFLRYIRAVVERSNCTGDVQTFSKTE
jgi:hypothetical protein